MYFKEESLYISSIQFRFHDAFLEAIAIIIE